MRSKSIMSTITVLITTMFFLTVVQHVVGSTPPATKKNSDKHLQTVIADQININTADAQTLTTVKGIGEKKAQSIVDYREKNGSFKNVEELINIKGIGEKSLEKLKKHLKVS